MKKSPTTSSTQSTKRRTTTMTHSNVVAPPLVAIEGVHRVTDGPKCACRVDGCNASYMAKYNLVWHLRACNNVTIELGKLGCPSTTEEGLRHQDYAVMNVQVLNNLLAPFHHNEQKAIAKVRRHANLEWDRLQVDL